MGGRGRGSSNARRGRSRSTAAAPHKPDDDTSAGVQLCVSCSKDVGDNPIGCDVCDRWVHATEMCSGLPQRVIDTIMNYDGRGINFVCTKCRILKESSASNNAQPLMLELVQQIFQQMKGLCNTVQNLMDQVKTLSTKPSPPTPAPLSLPPPPQPTKEDHILSIRKEIQEMNEREKRRSSVIVKGLGANSPRDFSQKFSQLTQDVMSLSTSLTDAKQIPGHPNMFRVKIPDEVARKQILEKSKSLRDSNYSGVFISRDLTYAQRAELFARRQARRAEANNQPDPAPSAPDPEPVPSLEGGPPTNQGNPQLH